ncbi:MAG: double-strand break repair protein AddB, partial [Hyphomicrobiales bacterium]|nr:double-strand break repair protein AddB [Hyphomicrobiales bacterium]
MRDAPTGPPHVYTIAPDLDFTRTLADNLLNGNLPVPGGVRPDELDLVNWTILVPTRRAARALMMAFVDGSAKGTRLLPRIRPLGDVDDDELAAETVLGGLPELDIPPAIALLQRQFLLARLILAWAHNNSDNQLARTVKSATGQALDLADSLGKLIDGFDNDEVDLNVIEALFGADLPVHKAEVLGFLDVIRVEYPVALANSGLSGAMARRSALIRAQADVISASPPKGPIIAAGSTGSIKATADLLNRICHLPLGAVVLPGLDVDMDDASWMQLDQQHPQYGLKELLQTFEIERRNVRELTSGRDDRAGGARCWLVSETMRPASTSEKWHELIGEQTERLRSATVGLSWIEAPDQYQEARIIALIMRQALEVPDASLQLVTPDRRLARQVKAELARWAIEVDDSAGEPLLHTPAGAFMALLIDAAAAGFAPRQLMSLLDHPYMLCGLTRSELAAAARLMEISVLRGRLEQPDLARLAGDVAKLREEVSPYSHPFVKNMSDEDWQRVADLATRLHSLLADLVALFEAPPGGQLSEFVSVHTRTAEALTSDPDTGLSSLWTGDAGDALSTMFGTIAEHAGNCPALSAREYADFITGQLAAVPVRPKHVRHPRIAIHGLLEARLISADITILGGLNESVWPAEAEIDPWLNRPQRRDAELQLPERRIGLTAHDFAQAVCSPTVWMTSSRKIDGQPAVPTRWLLRMQAILKAAGLEDSLEDPQNWLGWSSGLDEPGELAPVKPPKPRPPLEARPQRLSVTAIDKLIKDPYGIYARYVLKLEALESLDAQISARERGNLVHKALETFAVNHPGDLPGDAEARLLAGIEQVFLEVVSDPSLAAFWWPQMERIAAWYIQQDRDWRRDATQLHPECKGVTELAIAGRPFALSGIADRIDELDDGSLRILDYKTGQLPAKKPGSAGYSAQLDLISHMVSAGAFPGVQPAPVSDAAYVRLSGGDPGGEISALGANPDKRGEEAIAGLVELLSGYADPAQPYLTLNAADRERRPSDYDHLSRWREWGHL